MTGSQGQSAEGEIVTPNESERRELLEVLAHAFRDNPMNVAIQGGTAGRRVRANRAGLASLVLDSGERAVTRVLRREGRVVGGFVALRPGDLRLPRADIRRQLACLLHQGVRQAGRWAYIFPRIESFRPQEMHWYLASLGVDPRLWHRGLGGALIDALFALARSRPAPIYLESDRPESVAFYLRMGFTIRDEIELLGVPCVTLGHGSFGVR